MSKTIEPHVLKQYSVIRQMGSGAYGHVWQVAQRKTNARLALKKIFDAFRNSIDAQRTYRQVQVLHQLKHPNIIKLHKVIKAKNNKDLYMVFQYMEADLQSIVGTNVLQKVHQAYVFYQILKALKYIHSAQLIHRDLKPSNVLINSQCSVKLCDFGLIRSLSSNENQEVVLSQEVATKWYRAPELLLGSRSYGKPVDMWSFGCIVAQLLIGKPLFAGDSTINQLQKILEFTGQIHKTDIQSLQSPVAQQLIYQIKIRKKSFRDYFNGIDPDFYQLIKGLIQLNPNKRLTADQALELSIFNQFKQEKQQFLVCKNPIIPVVDDNIRLGIKAYRQKIYQDIDVRYFSSADKDIQKKYSKTKENKTLSYNNKEIKDAGLLSPNSHASNHVKRRPFSAIQNNPIKEGRTISSNKNKFRSVSKDKVKKYYSTAVLPSQKFGKFNQNITNINNEKQKSHHNVHVSRKLSPQSPYLYSKQKANNANITQDTNILKKYQIKSPTSKLVKKSSKNKILNAQKMQILKSLGIQKTNNLSKYMN